ncbi:condensation domain-containing protein [Paenibacillus solani]|uniref:condensation domain-containing protein n=1 Tax=Paenibacillus solani TaxID=1705565 RepID=UPI0009E96D6E
MLPEISFNYLGRWDREMNAGAMSMSGLSAGASMSPQSERAYSLDITGNVIDGKLTLSVIYDKQEYRESTMQALLANYKKQLLLIVAHCMQQTETELTPSDLGSARVTLEDLNELFSNL